jgi:hypothetical protein
MPGPCPLKGLPGAVLAVLAVLAVRVDRTEKGQLEISPPDDTRCPPAQVGHRPYGQYLSVGGATPPDPCRRLPPFLPDVGHDLKLSLRTSAQNGGRQGIRVDRVTTAVIHPPFTEHRVLCCGDQQRFSAVHGRTSVCDWNLEDLAICRPKQVRLNPDLTIGIIEAIGTRDLDGGSVGVAKPRLMRNPRLEKLNLGRNQRCLIKDGHQRDGTRQVRLRANDGREEVGKGIVGVDAHSGGIPDHGTVRLDPARMVRAA